MYILEKNSREKILFSELIYYNNTSLFFSGETRRCWTMGTKRGKITKIVLFEQPKTKRRRK